MDPRYDDSIAFLARWYGQAARVLTSIAPDRSGAITTTTFSAGDDAQIRAWLEQHGASRNVYFTVNPLRGPVQKKAAKTDVRALAWLHIDIDPRAGEEIGAEQERALRVLRAPPGNVPPPTVVVFSGGGYQGFWRLEEPVPIEGDVAAADDAARYNIQLEVLFGADHCHNVDRIMRLPGTINRPDEKKRKKGRVEALAELVEWHDDRVYPISAFRQAPRIHAPTGALTPTPAQVSGNVRRLSSLDELPATVSQEVKDTILQGVSPRQPDRHGQDRSRWLWWVCCELVRAEVSDETIYAIITDPEFKISSSVLDKRSGSKRYALRQITKAREYAIDPALAEMNDRHAVIGNVGGRCVVIEEVSEVFGDYARHRVTRQSFADIRNRYMHRSVVSSNGDPNKKVTKRLGDWWLSHPKRLEYDRIVFSPARDVPGAYNLWKGFACEAKPGDCGLYLDHVRKVICNDEDRVYRYVLGWMAAAVQKPDRPGHAAISLSGHQGTGKGKFATIFGSLFGPHFLHLTQSQHVVGNFNAHLRDCLVLFADEAFFAADPRHVSVLKTLITEETLSIEAKRFDVEQSPNYLHIIQASNDDWNTRMGSFERRFLVLKVSDDRRQDREYFRAIDDQMKSGGREGLLHYLLTLDISDYDQRAVPYTDAAKMQQRYSLDAKQEWWYAKLCRGEIILGLGWPEFVFADDLLYDFVTYNRAFQGSLRSNATKLGSFLTEQVMPKGFMHRGRLADSHEVTAIDGSRKLVNRPYVIYLPPLAVARETWAGQHGGLHDWDQLYREQMEIDQGEPKREDRPF